MKKKIIFIAILICFMVIFISLLNIKVATRQGINYEWHTVSLPLYLKILDFYDRHFNYENLVKKITKDAQDKRERVVKLFEWTHKNIRKLPEGLPVMDDHVWHIIVRGYGVADQSSDVFTTLCSYAGADAFFTSICTKDSTGGMPLTFVRLDKKWRIFDPYNGVYFKNKDGDFASIEQLKRGDWTVCNIGEANKHNSDYADYFKNLPTIKDIGFRKANIQSPLRRLLFEIRNTYKRLVSHEKD